MRFFLFGSFRRNLIFLVLVALLPALGLLLLTGHHLRTRIVADAENHALRQVQSMAAHHERIVDDARLLLQTLSWFPAIRSLEAPACQQLLADTLAGNPAYVSLALLDPRGNVVVEVPQQAARKRMPSDFVERALTSRTFTVGHYTFIKERHRVIVELGQPVIDDANQVRGLLVADFDLQYFGRLFRDTHLPEQSVFTLTDARGVRLTRFPETEKYTWVPDLPKMVRQMSGEEEEGTFLDVGVDGISRLYGYKRVRFQEASFPYLMIRVGIPVNTALADARKQLFFNVFLLGLAGLLALLAARVLSNLTIMRSLNRLIDAADQWKAGYLETRTGLDAREGELGQLAAAFDDMAEELEHKELARSRAEDELRRLNEELEERVALRTEELAGTNQELQQTLDNLQRAQEQLILSEKLAALGGLVAGVAHEINTPVGVALSAGSTLNEKSRSLSELFARGEMKRSDLTGYLGDVQEGARLILMNLNRASELIRSFKMVAADQVSENRRSFPVRQYIEEVLLSLRPQLKKVPHQVVVDCDPDLVIESYPGALAQILTNCIINSLTHGLDPEQPGEIRIGVGIVGSNVELRLEDNGKGMGAEVREHIFEPFFTTARSKGSTGLGMHIVFNLVTNTLGGTIACESEPGRGTVFRIRLPL
ncbi:MAG: sensor histidine kinase [Desulfobulbus sp.]|jgi:signal transduction histidine kinase